VKRVNKYLICENGELLKNIPKLVKEENSEITVISTKKSSLTNNKHIDNYISIDAPKESSFNDNFIANKNLISELNGWIIWGNDEIVRRVANSNIPLKEKLRVLPTKRKIGLTLLGSKVGLAKVSNKLNLTSPKTVIAENLSELKKYSSKLHTPFIIKADKHGGGGFVKKVSNGRERKALKISKDWYPVVIQEFIKGQVVAVEGFFKNGTLIAWMYSFFEDSLGEYGPSTSRVYKNPEVLDFQLDLIRLAKECGLHGMFNCTFILKDQKHYLIEADARPNSWQFLFSHFNLPIMEIMTEKQESPQTPLSPNLSNGALRISDLNRIIPYALSKKDYKTILISLKQLTNSTQWISGKKFTIALLVLSTILTPRMHKVKFALFSYAVATFRAQPETFQNFIKKLGLTRFIAFKIFRV
jgi:hypothetical protein